MGACRGVECTQELGFVRLLLTCVRLVCHCSSMFWVMEQLPGFVVSADQTAALRTNGYWGSYNIPFYKKVYEISGFEQMWVQPLRAAHTH